MLDKVECLGTTISAAGISLTAGKVQAIKDAAPPTNVSELQSFFELDLPIFYLHLCWILQSWLRLCTDYFVRTYHGDGQNWNKTFDNIKATLCSEPVLSRYDPMVKLTLQCDAGCASCIIATWISWCITASCLCIASRVYRTMQTKNNPKLNASH